jgi:hypothetical protein
MNLGHAYINIIQAQKFPCLAIHALAPRKKYFVLASMIKKVFLSVCVFVQVVLPMLNDSKAEHTTSTVEDVLAGSM